MESEQITSHNENDEKERAAVCGVPESEVREGVQAIVLSKSLEESAARAKAVYKRGQWPRFFLPKAGKAALPVKHILKMSGDDCQQTFGHFPKQGIRMRQKRCWQFSMGRLHLVI